MKPSRLLLLDERTSALDLHHQLAVMDILNAFVRETGALALAAMHDLSLAASQCSHVIVLDNWGISASGAPSEDAAGETIHVPVAAI